MHIEPVHVFLCVCVSVCLCVSLCVVQSVSQNIQARDRPVTGSQVRSAGMSDHHVCVCVCVRVWVCVRVSHLNTAGVRRPVILAQSVRQHDTRDVCDEGALPRLQLAPGRVSHVNLQAHTHTHTHTHEMLCQTYSHEEGTCPRNADNSLSDAQPSFVAR